MKSVRLDLRRDLSKVKRALPRLVAALPDMQCLYAAPCVIGTMIPKSRRDEFDAHNHFKHGAGIRGLIADGLVIVPPGQKRDFGYLQAAFDSGKKAEFCRTYERIARKYSPASVDTHPKDGDALAAPLVSGAARSEAEGDAQTTLPIGPSHGEGDGDG